MTKNTFKNTALSSISSLVRWPRMRLHPRARQRRRVIVVAESLALPAAALLIGWYIDPHDPLGLDADFPWIWLGPWLIAIRYSVGYSLLGLFMYFLAWMSFATLRIEDFPGQFFLGGTLVSLILGEFGAAYRSRTEHHRAEVNDLMARLQRSKRRLFVIRESLTQLEQELVDRPLTLRDALLSLRQRLIESRNQDNASSSEPPAPEAFLQILSQCCRVIEAGIYQKTGSNWHPIARLGRNLPTLTDDHPLIAHVLENGQSAHIAQTHLLDKNLKEWIYASILGNNHDSEANILLAIHNMPFMAFEENNLRRLDVLCACYADFTQCERMTSAIRAIWPDSPIGLQHEWASLLHIYEHTGLESHTAIWRFRQTIPEECIKELLLQQPPDTSHWVFRPASCTTCILVTLPITHGSKLTIYGQEMQEAFTNILVRYDINIDTLTLVFLPINRASDYSRLRKEIFDPNS